MIFWFKRKTGNRRFERRHVLDVKLRSSQVRAARTRLVVMAVGTLAGSVFGLYVLWRIGGWALDKLVYENPSFAIQDVQVETDGIISTDELRRWSGVERGRNLLALDLARVKRDLELEPFIQSVSVERILPRTLRIRVTEREPIARVNVPQPHPGGRVDLANYLLDGDGYVLKPLDSSQRVPHAASAEDPLPIISGINANDLQPGKRLDDPRVQAALDFIDAFARSPMAGVVDLQRVDISAPVALVATTGQGSAITFGLADFDRQLARWAKIYDAAQRLNKTIASLDLAVSNNIPAHWLDASAAPPPSGKPFKPPHAKKKNV
jgi:cell division septal protein FtsQ